MKNKAFTLLEIIIVIAVLSLIASVVGWQIVSAVNVHAFQKEVEEVYNAMRHAKVLSLTYRTDIGVRFLKEDGVLYYQLYTDEPFANTLFDREKKALKKIEKLTFNDKTSNRLDFMLYGNGNLEPRGVLGFSPRGKKKDAGRWLNFSGAFQWTLSYQKPPLLKERSPVFPEDQLKKIHSKKDMDIPDAVIKK